MINSFNELLLKIQKLKLEGKIDLSLDEDLSLAVMNLISLEEHFFFTGAKTNKEKYYEFLEEVRKIRQELLKKLIDKTEGEVWCISKHLLATSMRLIEVGTKYQSKGDKKNAKDFFEKAWKIYCLFWGIKLGLVELPELRSGESDSVRLDDKEVNLQGKLDNLLKELVNCCE